jgi:hypothetical protein
VTGCQAHRHRLFSHGWFSWLKHGHCGAAPAPAAVPVAAPTVTYCAGGQCQAPCGQQPYYPVQPQVIVPTVPAAPAPGTSVPPSIYTPIPGSTIPPPGTRFPATPADVPPSLGTPRPGTIIQPPAAPGAPRFPVDPAPLGTPPGSGFGGTTFPSGASYLTPADPYSSSSGLTGPALAPPTTTRAPAFNPSVQPVPDPAATRRQRPASRAPQLLDPRDKTANPGDQRWGVVPAVWPVKEEVASAKPAEQSPYRVYHERRLSTPAPDAAEYDSSGWTSSR